MSHFLYFFLFLALNAINAANSSKKSLTNKSLYSISSLRESEKPDIFKSQVFNTTEFFTKTKETEEAITFKSLIDSINLMDHKSLLNLLSKNNNLNFLSSHDEFGYTLLDYAIMNRNKKAITLLLEHIVFENFPFKKNTLLHLLSFKNNQEAKKIYSQTRLNEFLYLAILNQQSTLVEILLSLKANPYEKFFNDESAFDIAKKSGNLAIQELLENSNISYN